MLDMAPCTVRVCSPVVSVLYLPVPVLYLYSQTCHEEVAINITCIILYLPPPKKQSTMAIQYIDIQYIDIQYIDIQYIDIQCIDVPLGYRNYSQDVYENQYST